jgi:hypothetical protein
MTSAARSNIRRGSWRDLAGCKVFHAQGLGVPPQTQFLITHGAMDCPEDERA